MADTGCPGDSSCPGSAGGFAGEEGAAASFPSVVGGRRVLCGRLLQAAGSTSVISRGRCSGRFVVAGRCCCWTTDRQTDRPTDRQTDRQGWSRQQGGSARYFCSRGGVWVGGENHKVGGRVGLLLLERGGNITRLAGAKRADTVHTEATTRKRQRYRYTGRGTDRGTDRQRQRFDTDTMTTISGPQRPYAGR